MNPMMMPSRSIRVKTESVMVSKRPFFRLTSSRRVHSKGLQLTPSPPSTRPTRTAILARPATSPIKSPGSTPSTLQVRPRGTRKNNKMSSSSARDHPTLRASLKCKAMIKILENSLCSSNNNTNSHFSRHQVTTSIKTVALSTASNKRPMLTSLRPLFNRPHRQRQ